MARILLKLAIAAAALALMTPSAADAQWSSPWLKAESAHFIVYSDFGEHELRSNIDKLEDYDAILRRFDASSSEVRKAPKFKIFLVLGDSDVDAIYPGALNQTVGMLINSPQDVFFVDNRRSLMRQYENISDGWYPKDELLNQLVNYNLRYQYADKVILDTFGARAPTWFIAGASAYFADARFDARSVNLGTDDRTRAQAVLDLGAWIALPDLFTRKPFYMTPAQIDTYRRESWLLVHYMLSNDDRRQKLAHYLMAVEAGADPVAAWSDKVGVTFEAVRADLKAYVSGPDFGQTVSRAGWPHADGVVVTPAPASDDFLILDNQRLTLTLPDDGQATVLARVRADAAPYPNNPLARLVLGRAEVLYGDHGKGAALLAGLLRDDPNDVDAQLAQALGHMAEGDRDPDHIRVGYDAASEILDDTVKLAPDDPRVLFYRAKSHSLSKEYPDDQTIADLRHAVDLAPLSFETRRMLAEALAKTGRFDDAAAVMQPVIGFRLGEITRRAVEVLQDIEDQRGQKMAENR